MKLKPITEKLVTRKELAAFLQVTTRTVDNLREKGMPVIMVGSSPRFELATVKAWLVANHETARAGAVEDASALGDAIRSFPDPHRVGL